ncbi:MULTISPECIES: relaxase/mobilization nuclease domain-containing protein [unclassified Kaistella]|uniref:relaxase/mobilization nuclease domain-containing protein n=1 Tax=unclassified Kaistella TaxID=2762626 RepID=UPI0027328F16|nr:MULTISPECIES: relaxase/mobilization nuclease domain-containing protein [unclassified Kaistella]MDP2455236.1 relaxase/mobilization nuclease domain-containing protein [Kaistella sp. SH11-4b]MDP2458083.1 relaxase/mobilization nuclease domain-containing protein [Kaistella sp. SH40-3]MDP2461050.1 relaxase/mobilization nuclease domain-containing protein [Kaistella sp. SH19-2b]
MIVKIMPAAGSSFPGVNYNEKKIKGGKGELMMMKNFPSFINRSSGQQQVRNYLRAISVGNKKIIKPQFHAMISTKFKEHSKGELTEIAENFMTEMGYGKQPFIVVFHNDTDHNHVHINSTRVDKTSGKKINDSFEKLKSQKALSRTLEKLYDLKPDEELEKLLNYKVSTIKQLETLLERSHFILIKKEDDNSFDVLKNGVTRKTINFNNINFGKNKNDSRKNQITAILLKYKDIYSTKVFKVEDRRKQKSVLPTTKNIFGDSELKIKLEFESELQQKLRQLFGIDLVFHHKDNHQPFGYSLIDHKSRKVYKGSEVLKMSELFEFTEEKVDKRLFEVLKDFTIPNKESKLILLEIFNRNNPEAKLQDFMLFENRVKKDLETYREIKSEVRDHLRINKDKKIDEDSVSIIKSGSGEIYAVSTKHHFVGELQSLIGEKEYRGFLNSEMGCGEKSRLQSEKNSRGEVMKAVDEMLFEIMKNSGTAKDPGENELKRKRKKRK